MKPFNFELSDEEFDTFYCAIDGYFKKEMMNIQDELASGHDTDLTHDVIKWHIEHMEYFNTIVKKIGYGSDFDSYIQRMKEIHKV